MKKKTLSYNRRNTVGFLKIQPIVGIVMILTGYIPSRFNSIKILKRLFKNREHIQRMNMGYTLNFQLFKPHRRS